MKKDTNNLAKAIFFITAMVLVFPYSTSAYLAAPVANTKNATFITEKGALMNGAVNSNETPDTLAWFEWGITGRSTFYETTHRAVGSGAQLTDFSETVYGLAPNVQYFYRLVAESSRGRDTGVTTYFTTKNLVVPIDPVVIIQTNSPINILEKSAVLRGYIAPHQGQGVRWWFEWGISNRFENKTPTSGWGADSGVAQTTVTNLTPGTQYYYRIVAENTQGVVYGSAQILTTLGVAPLPSESARTQSVSQPQSGDGASRITTTSQPNSSNSNNNPTTQQAASGIMAFNWAGTNVNTGNNLSSSALVVPKNIFGSFFGGNNNSVNTKTQTGGNTTTGENTNTGVVNKPTETPTTPVGTFWNTLTGSKSTSVNIEKIGPATAPAHTPVEYRVTYAYRNSDPASNAKLKVILPGSVVYIGDNTTNELLLEEGSGPERTYILPVGRLENGSTRTISILGMTTGDAGGTFPDARSRLEYTIKNGSVEVVSAGGAAATQGSKSDKVKTSSSIFPSSVFGWLIYIGLITLLIYGIRKARAYYINRKEEYALEQESIRRDSGNGQFSQGPILT